MRVKAMEARNIIQNNYGWKFSLEPFWKWMNFIGMTTSKAEDITCLSSIPRWVIYLFVLFLHPSIFTHMICNTESIVSTYTKGDYTLLLYIGISLLMDSITPLTSLAFTRFILLRWLTWVIGRVWKIQLI